MEVDSKIAKLLLQQSILLVGDIRTIRVVVFVHLNDGLQSRNFKAFSYDLMWWM
jgi:hypothetical protein